MTRPIVARTAGRGGDPARRVLEQRRAAEEGLDQPRHGVLGGEPPTHRPVVGSDGAVRTLRASSAARIAAAASSVETSARWRPSPVNGSRNPAASPTSNQPGPARRVTRRPSGAAPASGSQRSAVAPRGRIAVGRRDRGHDRVDDRAGALAGEPFATTRPSTIPMLTRPPGTGAIPM